MTKFVPLKPAPWPVNSLLTLPPAPHLVASQVLACAIPKHNSEVNMLANIVSSFIALDLFSAYFRWTIANTTGSTKCQWSLIRKYYLVICQMKWKFIPIIMYVSKVTMDTLAFINHEYLDLSENDTCVRLHSLICFCFAINYVCVIFKITSL